MPRSRPLPPGTYAHASTPPSMHTTLAETHLQEPRGGGQDALKKTMAEYYGAIQGGGGAVFFAVCRGKVGGC